eukprot:TRINITY_DN394_c0_g1_i3.p1 TRINITY_DN394_c0_g1~~TRINITY_DN394_c0_g1_i3.p1  ORF type:complete len:491 (+),score=114.46 TRINITY_DN394_c0_g1_i3:196-1668(+)
MISEFGMKPDHHHSVVDASIVDEASIVEASVVDSSLLHHDSHSDYRIHPVQHISVNVSKVEADGSPSEATMTIDGVVYNSRGYEVCGHLNQHNKPCQRIGKCPFHDGKVPKSQPSPTNQIHTNSLIGGDILPERIQSPHMEEKKEKTPMKTPYKQGWTKEEHVRFLNGLQIHGKGAWKEISLIVNTRTPTQIQSHAQKYYLRQKQSVKNKRSIHDLTIEDLQDMQDPNMVRNNQHLHAANGNHANSHPMLAKSAQHSQVPLQLNVGLNDMNSPNRASMQYFHTTTVYQQPQQVPVPESIIYYSRPSSMMEHGGFRSNVSTLSNNGTPLSSNGLVHQMMPPIQQLNMHPYATNNLPGLSMQHASHLPSPINWYNPTLPINSFNSSPYNSNLTSMHQEERHALPSLPNEEQKDYWAHPRVRLSNGTHSDDSSNDDSIDDLGQDDGHSHKRSFRDFLSQDDHIREKRLRTSDEKDDEEEDENDESSQFLVGED